MKLKAAGVAVAFVAVLSGGIVAIAHADRCGPGYDLHEDGNCHFGIGGTTSTVTSTTTVTHETSTQRSTLPIYPEDYEPGGVFYNPPPPPPPEPIGSLVGPPD